MSAADDELALVTRIACGDQEAAAAFDTKFRALLHRFLVGRVPAQERDDLVQDVLLAAFQKIRGDGFQGASSLGTWLIGILKHKVADYYELQKRGQSRVVQIDAAPLSRTSSPLDDIPDWHHGPPEIAIEVEQMLASLPRAHRVVLILNLRERHTTNEIASLLKLPPGTVSRIIWEAKRMLRPQHEGLKKLTGGADK